MNYNLINPELIAKNPMLKLCKQIYDLTDGLCQVGAGPYGFGTANNHKAPIGIIVISDPPMVKDNTILPDDIDGYNIRVECYSKTFDCVLTPKDMESYGDSADPDTIKILNAWRELCGDPKYISTADCGEAYDTIGDLEYTQDVFSFYCPIDVCHFPGMTYEDLIDIDDCYEEWFLQDYRIQDTAFLKDDAAADFDNRPDIQETMAFLKDEFRGILPNVTAAHFDFVDKNGRLWLNAAFAVDADATVKAERMREFAAQCISNNDAMQGGSFQKDEGLYLMSIEPYRIYNQTNCAAPVYQENALLTEEELRNLPNEDEDIEKNQGMGGIT